jgi:hypothetical protein
MCPYTFFLFVLIAAVIGIIVWSFWKNNLSLNVTLQSCGGRKTGLNDGVLDANGRQVAFHYQPGSRNNPSLLRLTLTGNFFAHAVFHSESSTDRLAKNIGLNQEIQLNDPVFDQAVYIECEDRAFIDRLFNESDTRELVRNLLRNFTRLEINGCRCLLVKTPCDDLATVSSDEITAAALGLDQLARQLPPAAGGESSATPLTDECRRLEQFSITVAVGIAVVGVPLMIWGLAAFEPVLKGRLFGSSLYVSLPLAGLASYYFFNQLKGFSTSARFFMTAALVSAIGLVLCIWGGEMVLNGLLDISQSQAHECVVMDKRVSHSKNSTTYYVVTSSWSALFPSYEFSVSRAKYDQLTSGDPCQISSRAGYLGFEWVVSHTCNRRSGTISNQ